MASGGGKVYALDQATGTKKWQFPADANHIAASGSSLYAAPIVGGDYVFAGIIRLSDYAVTQNALGVVRRHNADIGVSVA